MPSSPHSQPSPQVFWDGGNLVIKADVINGELQLKPEPENPESLPLINAYQAEIREKLILKNNLNTL